MKAPSLHPWIQSSSCFLSFLSGRTAAHPPSGLQLCFAGLASLGPQVPTKNHLILALGSQVWFWSTCPYLGLVGCFCFASALGSPKPAWKGPLLLLFFTLTYFFKAPNSSWKWHNWSGLVEPYSILVSYSLVLMVGIQINATKCSQGTNALAHQRTVSQRKTGQRP